MIYNVIEVFTREDVRWKGRLLSDAIIDYMHGRRIAARVIVSKGIAGCYESGEVSTHTILDLSYNMPLKIEIILPGPELETVLPTVEEMVTDGIVAVQAMEIRSHKSAKRFLPQYLKVKDVMVGKPSTISANQVLSEIVQRMLSKGLKWIPVVGPENRVQGIVAQKELVKAGMPISLGLAASMDPRQIETKVSQLPQKKALDLMTRPAVTVKEEEYLPEAVRIMLKKNLKRLPVLNERDEIVGVLSRLDIFRSIIQNAPDWTALEKRNVMITNQLAVRDMVNRESTVVRFDTPVMKVLEILRAGSIQRAAVVDQNGLFLGIITDYELLPLLTKRASDVWDYFTAMMDRTKVRPMLDGQLSSGLWLRFR